LYLLKPSYPSTTRLAAFLLGMAGAASAFADCEVTRADAVTFPTVKIIGSRPPGTVLATTHASLVTLCTTIGHRHSGALGFYLKAANYRNNMRPVKLPDGSYAWSTSIRGIGLRITGGDRNESISALTPGTAVAYRVTEPHKGHMLWNDTFKYELVVTGPTIGVGTISGGLWDIYWHDIGINSGGIMKGVSNVSTTVMVPPRSTSCSVNTASKSQAIALGTVTVSDLKAGGKGQPARFSVNLTCTGAEAGAPPIAVAITLTDAVYPGNRGSVLELDNTSTARGAGVQLRKESGEFISLGADAATPGNFGQWIATTTGNGSVSIPMTASIVATDYTAIKAGSLRAAATFTMSYQ